MKTMCDSSRRAMEGEDSGEDVVDSKAILSEPTLVVAKDSLRSRGEFLVDEGGEQFVCCRETRNASVVAGVS